MIPYSIVPDADQPGCELDLDDLGPNRFRGFATMFSYGNGRVEGGEVCSSDTTVQDYDEKFIEKLLDLKPPQRVRDYLQHHLDYSIRNLGGDAPFLDQFECVILHALEQHYKHVPATQVARTWFNKTMDNIHKQQRRERDHFLSEAFRVAHEHNPSNPFSVNINPRELGKHLGFDEGTTTRIMHDLVDDKLVTSGLGMHMLLFTAQSRRYLEQLHGEDDPQANPPAINIHASHRATVLVQSNSPNSAQSMGSQDVLTEVRSFTEQLMAQLVRLETMVSAEQTADIKADLEYIKRKLDAPEPSKSLLQTAKNELVKKLVGLPIDVAKSLGMGMLALPT
ncbi:MAG: hypothetical protein JST66_12205 [Bacteroidetes bacterium]|nr:hypothetical protein [Bacteroidota bacterium]